MIFQRIADALCIDLRTLNQVMPPTLIYNEGWMLRLVLDRLAALRLEEKSFELAIPEGCSWYSEALLPSPFPSRTRVDAHGESWTHVDGAIGHFSIGKGAKRNLELNRDAKHFVIIEAKMYSRLAKGVKNASDYSQAARNFACMARALEKAEREPGQLETLGFYVIAPEKQIEKGLFVEQLEEYKVCEAVKLRINDYKGEKIKQYQKMFERLVVRLDWKKNVKPLSWECILEFLIRNDPASNWLEEFYKQCKKYNKPNYSRQG